MDQSLVPDKLAAMAVVTEHKDPLVVGLARTVIELIEAISRLSANQAATEQAVTSQALSSSIADHGITDPSLVTTASE